MQKKTHPLSLSTGATGLVGSRLVARLAAAGTPLRIISRDPAAARARLPLPRREFFGPADLAAAVDGASGVVNLAGEPIAARWSPSIKAEIRRSRVEGTAKLVDAIASTPAASRPAALVSTSAIGYYGTSETGTFAEDAPAGDDFLAQVCIDWEREALKAEAAAGVRVVIIRAGIVLSREGGALGRMLPVFNAFSGGPLGSGKQWCSWVHRDDLIALYLAALNDPSYAGVYNGTAPNPVRMAELCAALGGALGRPSWLPVPDFAIKVRDRDTQRERDMERREGAGA